MKYFCIDQRCRDEDPTLLTRYKPRKSDQDERKFKKHKEKAREERHDRRYEYDKSWDPELVKKSSKRCGECNGCLRTENCGKCDPCR